MDVGDDFDTYEPEEPPEDFLPDIDENALEEEVAAREEQNGESDKQKVVTGDPNAGQKKPTSENDKKIPDEKRTTTPYMTKYERARVLGTRALQIRSGTSYLFTSQYLMSPPVVMRLLWLILKERQILYRLLSRNSIKRKCP